MCAYFGMATATDRRHDAPARVALVCGGVLVVVGVVLLVGWAAGVEVLVSLRPGLPPVRPATVFCLTTVGVALVLGARGRRTASRAFGAAVVVLPVLTLIESTAGWDIDSDLLLLGDAPGRLQAAFDTPDQMAPVAAVALLLLAVGLVAQGSPRLSHACGLAAGVAGYLALAGHLYGVEGVLEVGGSTAVPLHGGALLLVAALGLLCLTPDAGLVQLLREPGNMGTMVRQLSVFALVVPVIVGSVFWAGERAGWYGTAAGVALTTMAWTAGTLMIIWLGGRRAVPVERERDESLAHAVEVRDRLQMVAEASRDFAVTPDLDATLQRVAESVGRRLGGGCTIRLIDATGTLLLPVALHHPDPERLAALAAIFERPLAIDEGLSGHVIASGSAGIVERYSPSSLGFIRDPALVGALEEYGRPSAVVASLRAGGQALGAITVLRDEGHEPFHDDDLDVLVEMAERAAPVIRNAQIVADQRRRDTAMAEFARGALASDNPAGLHQSAVDLLRGALGAAYVVYLEADGEERLLVTALAGPPGQPSPLPRGAPVTAPKPLDVLRTGDPYVCDDMHHEASAEMVALAETLGADSGLAVRVRGELAPLGVLTIVAVGTGRFADDDIGYVQAYAGLFAAAVQRLQAQQALRSVAEERRRLLDRLVTAQEDERARIADGVHEDQVQVITAADLQLGVLARLAGNGRPDLSEDVAFAQRAVSGAAERLRALLFDLEPPEEGVDLEDALQSVAAYLLSGDGVTWRVASDSAERLSAGHRVTVYRIAKEALSNAARHARADRVEVSLSDVDGGVLTTVVDNGVGMAEVPERSPAGHRGVTSMRDWAAVSGGWLAMESTPGAGTTVRFWLPGEPEK